ncbi:MAG: serine/threonine-protein phosphatase [Anaerostipes sp.]|nr:serine/threonine-protein phosphatase [Anaerostipes sp.]
MGGRKKEKQISDELTYRVLHQLGKMEHMFSWLSRCYLEEQVSVKEWRREKLRLVLEELDRKYCYRCSKREMCQKKIENAMEHKGVLDQEDVVSFLTCHGGPDMIREANQRYQAGLQEIMLEQQRMVHQRFFGRQYQSAANMIRECMMGLEKQDQYGKQADSFIKKQAKSSGLEIGECFRKEQEGHLEIILCLRCRKGEKTAREVGRILSQILRRRMKPQPRCRSVVGESFLWMEFIEEPRFYALSGAMRTAKQGEAECGEQFAMENIGEDCFVAAICDGLGTGRQAGQESKRIIELLEKLLESEILPETAVEMVRSSMLFSSWHERYVTLDCLILDLHTGIGKLLKLGAAESFIIRGRMVEVIAGDAPPVGVFIEEKIDFIRKKFNDGDKIIMVSDGVLDEFGGREAFVQFLKLQRENCPQKICNLIMEKVSNQKDDCTALAIGIWNK